MKYFNQNPIHAGGKRWYFPAASKFYNAPALGIRASSKVLVRHPTTGIVKMCMYDQYPRKALLASNLASLSSNVEERWLMHPLMMCFKDLRTA